jgi:hypothetical protein
VTWKHDNETTWLTKDTFNNMRIINKYNKSLNNENKEDNLTKRQRAKLLKKSTNEKVPEISKYLGKRRVQYLSGVEEVELIILSISIIMQFSMMIRVGVRTQKKLSGPKKNCLTDIFGQKPKMKCPIRFKPDRAMIRHHGFAQL